MTTLPKRSTLETLRASFPSLCFQTESNIWPRHEWTVAIPVRCVRCGQAPQKHSPQ